MIPVKLKSLIDKVNKKFLLAIFALLVVYQCYIDSPPLHSAVKKSYKQIDNIEDTTDIDKPFCIWGTPLYFAVLRNQPKHVEALLASGANLGPDNGIDLLDKAIVHSDSDTVQLLMIAGAVFDPKYISASDEVFATEDTLELLQYHYDLNKGTEAPKFTQLHKAAQEGDTEEIQLLITAK